MIIAYDGSDYHGFQIQPDKMTVQQVLQDTISELTGTTVHVTGSGRTDAGVHARGQVIHFHTDSPIPTDRWTRIMNGRLPADIVVRYTVEVSSSFHARRSAQEKTYRYTIHNARIPDVFRRKYELHVPRPLDWNAMADGLQRLIGKHDFTSFTTPRTDKTNRVRTIYAGYIEQDEQHSDLRHIYVRGNGFLYNMVRIIVGTLLEIGLGNMNSAQIDHILAARNRAQAGPTAPPQGLQLWEVKYPDHLG